MGRSTWGATGSRPIGGRRRAAVLAVAVAALLTGCSKGSDGDAAAPSTTAAKGPSATTTTKVGAQPATTGIPACSLVDPSDFTKAGVQAEVLEVGDVSKTFTITPSLRSTACTFSARRGATSYGVTVALADGAPADALDPIVSAANQRDEIQPLSGLGDVAYWQAHTPTAGDDPASAKLWVRQGARVLEISTVDTRATPKAALVAVAKVVLAR